MSSPDQLVQIVDAALADAVERSGGWLACGPGCAQCCHGVFSISALDAHRLRAGLDCLDHTDSARAAAVRRRVAISAERLAWSFPGDVISGSLYSTPEALEAFDSFADDEACPALDPASQTCDLYAARPVLCRTFGPPLRTPDDGLAVCELCFDGASPEEIDRCQIDPAILDAEREAEAAFGAQSDLRDGEPYRTIVTFALRCAI
jgi:Fe-S-cluster containining protein